MNADLRRIHIFFIALILFGVVNLCSGKEPPPKNTRGDVEEVVQAEGNSKTPTVENRNGHWKRENLTKAEIRWLDQHSEIKYGFDRDWSPIEFVDIDVDEKVEKHAGASRRILDLIEEKMELKFTAVSNKTWRETYKKAQEKDGIHVLTALVVTPERRAQFLFTNPVFTLPAGVAVSKKLLSKKDWSWRGIQSLEGKRLAIVNGYAVTSFLLRELLGCSIRVMEAPPGGTKKPLDVFESWVETNGIDCAVLLIRPEEETGKWTVAGLRKDGTVERDLGPELDLDDPESVAAKALDKDCNHSEIARLIMGTLGHEFPDKVPRFECFDTPKDALAAFHRDENEVQAFVANRATISHYWSKADERFIEQFNTDAFALAVSMAVSREVPDAHLLRSIMQKALNSITWKKNNEIYQQLINGETKSAGTERMNSGLNWGLIIFLGILMVGLVAFMIYVFKVIIRDYVIKRIRSNHSGSTKKS